MQYHPPNTFVKNIVDVNRQAGVAPDVVDLIEAYCFLRLRKSKAINFYNSAKALCAGDQQFRIFIGKNKELDNRSKNFITAYYQEMREQNHPLVLNCSHLAHILEHPLDNLFSLTKKTKKNYQNFSISKSNGNRRQVQAPKQHLKNVQRNILDLILHQIPLNDHAEGFRHKRSIRSNAARHVQKRVVIKIDIKDFFPSISYQRVLGMFLHLGYPRQVATLLSSLTTHQSILPTGAPTSPAIANIICRKLDKRLARLGDKTDFDYSRYADDMTISGNEEHIVKMIPFFKEIIVDEGFEINESKLRIMRGGRRQTVTGIVVNSQPNIVREERKKLRATLHNCQKGDLWLQKKKWARERKSLPHFAYTLSDFKRSLLAQIHYVKMINNSAGEKLITSFRSISWPV